MNTKIFSCLFLAISSIDAGCLHGYLHILFIPPFLSYASIINEFIRLVNGKYLYLDVINRFVDI